MAEATVSAGMIRQLTAYAVEQGADWTELVRRAGVDAADLPDQDARVPFANYVALMRAAKALTGDDALPLKYAAAIDMAEFSLVGLIANSAETMMHAFQQLNRYGRLVVEVDGIGDGDRFSISMIDGEMWLADNRANPNAFFELTETTFTRMATGPRRFLPRPPVKAVHVTHPRPAHAAEYERIFQCPVTFGSHWNALHMDKALALARVQQMPRYVFGVLSERAEGLLRELEGAKTTRGRVESLMLPILHTGEIGVDLIAGKLGVSRQTLFRRLKAEGTTFEQVLDALRQRLAVDYLAGRKVSVNETAYLVGFSDPAAFSRAFKRWTGVSPSVMRQLAAE